MAAHGVLDFTGKTVEGLVQAVEYFPLVRVRRQVADQRGLCGIPTKLLDRRLIIHCHGRRRSVGGYFGGCRPGDASHSLMCEAVSASRALRIISSRNAPGGSNLASVRRRV